MAVGLNPYQACTSYLARLVPLVDMRILRIHWVESLYRRPSQKVGVAPLRGLCLFPGFKMSFVRKCWLHITRVDAVGSVGSNPQKVFHELSPHTLSGMEWNSFRMFSTFRHTALHSFVEWLTIKSIQTRAQGKASPIEIVQKKSENLREKLKPGANENNNTPWYNNNDQRADH